MGPLKRIGWWSGACALFAGVAAVFWFLSAVGDLPPMVTYWDRAPTTDPFIQALMFSARMNKWAAGFSCLSALCVVGGRLWPDR